MCTCWKFAWEMMSVVSVVVSGFSRTLCKGVQVYRQVRQVVQRASRQKVVDVGKRRLQTACQRRIVDGANQRVEPDQAMTASLEPGDLVAKLSRIATVPPVRDNQHHRSTDERPAAPSLMELFDRLSDPRPAGPVTHPPRHRAQRIVGPCKPKISRDSRELG